MGAPDAVPATRRVAREKAVCDQRKADRRGGHHRKVLHPRHVRDAKGVPQHHVRVDNGAVRRRPRREARVAARRVGGGEGHLLGGKLAGGVPLVVVVGGDPQGAGGKRRPAGDGAAGGGEEGGVDAPAGRWNQLVRHRRARHRVQHVRVGHPPRPPRRRVPSAPPIGGEHRLCRRKGVAGRVPPAPPRARKREHIHLRHGVARPVNGHVQAAAKHVLVHLCIHPRRHQHPVARGGAGGHLGGRRGVGGQLPRQAYVKVNGPIQGEGHLVDVLIVDDR